MKRSIRRELDFLIKYVDKRFEAAEKAQNAAQAASDKAIEKSDKTAENWRNQANEWRGTLTDRDETFAKKTEQDRNAEDIKKLQLSEATLAGKASQNSVIIAFLLALVAIVISIIAIFSK